MEDWCQPHPIPRNNFHFSDTLFIIQFFFVSSFYTWLLKKTFRFDVRPRLELKWDQNFIHFFFTLFKNKMMNGISCRLAVYFRRIILIDRDGNCETCFLHAIRGPNPSSQCSGQFVRIQKREREEKVITTTTIVTNRSISAFVLCQNSKCKVLFIYRIRKLLLITNSRFFFCINR